MIIAEPHNRAWYLFRDAKKIKLSTNHNIRWKCCVQYVFCVFVFRNLVRSSGIITVDRTKKLASAESAELAYKHVEHL